MNAQYKDATLPVEERVEDLLSRMTIEDKAGMMFQPIAAFGDFDAPGLFNSPSTRSLLERKIRHANILGAGSAREIAQWTNAVQRETQATELAIPFTFSSDPRHSFSDNPATQLMAGPFSQWPESLGFGALDDPELVRKFAEVVRAEYLAVGIRLALHPQIDLATESRWARTNGTFGEDADLVSRLGVAYIEGLQGENFGPESVSVMAKHFPGGGPQKDGEDPHFAYGREQVYPGGRFEYHLKPFRAAIAAGVRQLMPYYGMPVDTEYEEVGFSFNRQIITELLREQLGFTGIVCSDWGILARTFWGVEDLSFEDRMCKALDAGVDQFGGEFTPEVLVELVKAGRVPEARLDVSVRRLLAEKFELGLFEHPFVDEEAADSLVGSSAARAAGVEAQTAAQVLLVNKPGTAHLPLKPSTKIYLEGVEPDAFSEWAQVVGTPQEADVAIVRTVAPWEQRGTPGTLDGMLESFFHAGSLEFGAEQLEHLRELADHAALIVDVYLDRPAILAPIAEIADTLIVNFGACPEAFAAILSGKSEPKGRLPFEIPSSTAAVEASRPDTPFDTADPTFRFGAGLGFQSGQGS